MSRQPIVRGAHREAGFSLMEMLVAIGILALVLAFLPGTFQLTRRTWDATAVLDQQAKGDGARGFLLSRLAEAVPLFEQIQGGAVKILFAGSADTLSFIAPSPNGPQGAGLYRFTLESRSQGAGGRNALVVAVTPYVPPRAQGGDDAPPAEEHVLYENIAGASFRYLGRKDVNSAAAAWNPEWTRRDALPDAVELSITTGRSVRTILVELRLRNTS